MLRPILVVGIVLVVLLTAYEVRAWRTGRTLLTPAQKPLRIASAAVMLAVLFMLLAGDAWLARYGPLAIMAYWMLCFLLGGGLLILLLLDVRELLRGYREVRRSVFMDTMTGEDDERPTE
jgi:hypothetical protein